MKKFISYLIFGNLMTDIRLMQKAKQAHLLSRNKVKSKLLSIMITYFHKRIFRNYACDITPDYELGEVIFRHPLGIVIGGGAKLSNGVIIHQGVTLGAIRFDQNERRGIPCEQIIGENTILCAGAKILGDVTIGKNCVIGANAVVTKDIPDNSVVVGFNKILPNKEMEYN